MTGTDTGVGKTVFAASLVHYLRRSGVRALGMKPFCSRGRDDVELLRSVQPGELSDEEANPFFYRRAVAPLVAQRQTRESVSLTSAVRKIRAVKKRCDVLVIEGSGGLMVPLGEDFLVTDLIRELRCEVVIVARNRLGTINHTLLTVGALRNLRVKRMKVVLMDCGDRDDSTGSNLEILGELLAPVRVVAYPFLGQKVAFFEAIRRHERILKKVLAGFLE